MACMVGIQEKMAGNSKVCMELKAKWLFLKLYICDFHFEKKSFVKSEI